MNWKRFYVILAFVITNITFAQANLLNAKKVEDINKQTQQEIDAQNDKPIPYGYVSKRDVMWSKIVWEYIDLRQKVNLPYYYPIDDVTQNNRLSLYDTLLKGIKNGEIKEIYSDSYFKTKIGLEDVSLMTHNERDDGYGNTDAYNVASQDIKGFLIKGIWYFDKRQGELKYRLLAIAPMGPDVQSMGVEGVDDREGEYPLFWVFYPDARETLHKSKAFNPNNSSDPISFDNLLNARRFSAVIQKEENVYGDRAIKDYIKENSLFQLLEADRIKENIRNREMDMWNY